jgi:hypothetical protein
MAPITFRYTNLMIEPFLGTGLANLGMLSPWPSPASVPQVLDKAGFR